MKYKLIKEYPGSPRLGTINGFSTVITLGLHLVENQPEFWEEIVEKDYEILSMKCNNSNCLHSNNSKSSIDFMLENDYKINSIKRLSDGEIFTIGDSVRIIKSTNPCCEQGKIKDFCFWLDNINNLQKIKQPLFTTEDGVDIFEGDEYYYISNNRYDTSYWNPVLHLVDWRNHVKPPLGFIQFSTKEKAEEYIVMNKPCLSINDLETILKEKKCFAELLISYAKKLVKQKLNK